MADSQRIRNAMDFAAEHAADYREEPASLPEARDMRQDAIRELAKIHSEMPKASGLMKQHLKDESRKTMDRITAINNWIAAYSAKIGSESRPRKNGPPEEPAPMEHSETCGCGEPVEGQRGSEAWFFYCHQCGAAWERPAERKRQLPPKMPKKKCQCSRACRFCGGERRP